MVWGSLILNYFNFIIVFLMLQMAMVPITKAAQVFLFLITLYTDLSILIITHHLSLFFGNLGGKTYMLTAKSAQ